MALRSDGCSRHVQTDDNKNPSETGQERVIVAAAAVVAWQLGAHWLAAQSRLGGCARAQWLSACGMVVMHTSLYVFV